MEYNLSFYKRLSFIKRYDLKFLFVAFLGIHIPLLGIVFFLLYAEKSELEPFNLFMLTLILTLFATVITLYFLNELLRPLRLAKSELESYLIHKKTPQLPVNYQDEVGVLMAKTQFTIEKLQQLIDEKQDIISLLSHDLRSHIKRILGITFILKKSFPNSDPQQEYFYHIEEACINHSTLLGDLLNLLKHENGMICEESLQDVELVPFIQTMIKEEAINLEDKSIKVNFKYNLPVVVKVDKTLFQQAFQNVIQNAIKFSFDNNDILVNLSASENGLKLTIKDFGIGFDNAIADRIFDRFTKYGQKGTAQEPTTGLGLYLTKKIIEQHKGEITAYSEGKDKGATITIKLPVHKIMPRHENSELLVS